MFSEKKAYVTQLIYQFRLLSLIMAVMIEGNLRDIRMVAVVQGNSLI